LWCTLVSVHDIVYTNRMKNITLSADADLLEKARLVAKAENTTLNAAFREWLQSYVRQRNLAAHRALRDSLKHINAGGPFTRDEMNER